MTCMNLWAGYVRMQTYEPKSRGPGYAEVDAGASASFISYSTLAAFIIYRTHQDPLGQVEVFLPLPEQHAASLIQAMAGERYNELIGEERSLTPTPPSRSNFLSPSLLYRKKGISWPFRRLEARESQVVGPPMELVSLVLKRLFLLLLSLLSCPTNTIARGGDLGAHPPQGSLIFPHFHLESVSFRLTRQNRVIRRVCFAGFMGPGGGLLARRLFEDNHPEITYHWKECKGLSIGKLLFQWVIEISDKPGQEEPEPSFKATLIVKHVHLHILPTMNPDGFALRRRGNANNVDLNRDFPDQGALVANYPWDGSQDTRMSLFIVHRKQYTASPDDKTFRYMASLYSRSHYNMSMSQEFEGGITNGALWYDISDLFSFVYPIYGGMQDWNYIHGGCFELTLEISDNKWPQANEVSFESFIDDALCFDPLGECS
ncbi:hypothetical protein B296_00051876 [Ensete ventricosum]|uniref:Peptidase M14 domain-containing protein n=2 Tax=Ensete ventricosum TaxID=4639 RepID=A0A426XMQ7_ENSVE|nr:hypothetical protein B296_00051876 [Ensete ventricosum]